MEAYPHPFVGVKGTVDAVVIGLVTHVLACAAQMFLKFMEDDGVLRQRLLKGGHHVWDVYKVDDNGWFPTV